MEANGERSASELGGERVGEDDAPGESGGFAVVAAGEEAADAHEEDAESE